MSLVSTPSALEIGWLFQSVIREDKDNIGLYLDAYGRAGLNSLHPELKETALHHAVTHYVLHGQNLAMINMLMRKNANPFMTDGKGRTVLQHAMAHVLERTRWTDSKEYAPLLQRLTKYEKDYREKMFELGLGQRLVVKKLKPAFTREAGAALPKLKTAFPLRPAA